MTEEEIKSQPTYTEQCDVRRCPLQKVEGQELGQGQGTHLQEHKEETPPPPTLGSQGDSSMMVKNTLVVSRELFKPVECVCVDYGKAREAKEVAVLVESITTEQGVAVPNIGPVECVSWARGTAEVTEVVPETAAQAREVTVTAGIRVTEPGPA